VADCYTAALRILNYRFNSEGELRRKLAAKRFEDAEIDATIERLRAERWLDDARFAGAFVRTRSQKNIGRLRIRRELLAAGVEDEVIDAALREHGDDDRERAQLLDVARKKLRRLGSDALATREGRDKLAAYLAGRGYDHDAIREVLRELTRLSS
jgi:regulatory protein